MQTTGLIAEHLPFSEDEFYRAFRLVLSEKKAREGAAFVVQLVRKAQEGAERARLARARGSQNPREIQVPAAVIGDDAFALLALVSDDLRERVDAYMHAQREELREQWLRDGLYRPGGVVIREATPEVHAEVEMRIRAAAAEWQALCETTRADVEQRQKRRR